MRRQFQLTEEDTSFLGLTGYSWEAVVENSTRWLLIHNYPLPIGYTQTVVSIALHIEPTYPDTQIDMVYFHPSLQRADGQGISALAEQVIDNKTFQRWSRHRTNENPWRPGVDDVSTHLALVDDWLTREFRLRMPL